MRRGPRLHGAAPAGLATALNPYIGSENATHVAKEALRTGRGMAELVTKLGVMKKQELDAVLQPEVPTHQRKFGS